MTVVFRGTVVKCWSQLTANHPASSVRNPRGTLVISQIEVRNVSYKKLLNNIHNMIWWHTKCKYCIWLKHNVKIWGRKYKFRIRIRTCIQKQVRFYDTTGVQLFLIKNLKFPLLIHWWQWKDYGDNWAHIVHIKNKW